MVHLFVVTNVSPPLICLVDILNTFSVIIDGYIIEIIGIEL